MIMVALENITVTRGRHTVLHGASTTFRAGRLTVVIGPNGAGKSTLLDVAAGLLPPSAGRVMLDGQPLSALSRRDLAIRRAYLPQNPQVDWAISVERVVALGLTAHLPAFGGLPGIWRARIDTALDRFDLADLRDRPATQLSGGELARVMLARATIGDPALLIVDEPTAGLDPRHALDAGRRLRALADAGCAVVVALHDLDLAARIADDVVALKAGRIEAHGPADAVLTAANLGHLYDIEAHVARTVDGVAIRFHG
ncbi:ABC transporter ATP-binding protein [Sphingomonadaceae bacterium jetA1]|jgi:iron complex transport system ATP-binding protein|uniref:ABC transporter ATP-binding protein n=1 Tax=Facivitalis istanbulensis TaxID=3075838 RepID=UPI00346D400A